MSIENNYIIYIFGPPASGKMTIAQNIAKKINCSILYNHLTMDLSSTLFKSSPVDYLKFWIELTFFTVSKYMKSPSTSNKPLIITDVWHFNKRYDNKFKLDLFNFILQHHKKIYGVELFCDLETRQKRTNTENRLKYKPLKKELDEVKDLSLLDKKHIFNSNSDIYRIPPNVFTQLLSIDTKELSPEESSSEIIQKFSLK